MSTLTDEEMDALATRAAPSAAPTSSVLTDAQMDEMATAPAAAPGLLQSFGRGALEGAVFGFDDELGLQDKAKREASKKANPWTHFMGEMAGAALPMAVATPLAAVRGAGLAARGVRALATPLAIGDATTLAQGIGQGAKLGASMGALSGAGHGEGLADRATDAITGGAIGAALGVPLGAAGYGISKVAQRIGGARAAAKTETEDAGQGALIAAARGFERDALPIDDMIAAVRAEFPDDTAAAGLARRFWGPINNKQPVTAADVEETVRLAAQGYDANAISMALGARRPNQVGPGPAAVQSLIEEIGTRSLGPLNLVDRAAMARTGSGQNTQMQMRAAAATPGRAASDAREALLERQLGAQQRLNDLVERMVGTTDLEGAAATHNETFRTAAARLYTDAFAQERPFDLAPIFTRWEQQFDRMRGVIPDTVRQRLNAMMWRETNAAGQTVRTPPQDLQSFMYAREGLRDVIGDLPQGNNLRRHLTRMYDEMTEEVARTNPLWREANNLYRDGIAANEAMEAGAAMGLRLNARSREGLTIFDRARTDHENATTALNQAKRNILQRPRGTVPERLDAQQLANATPAQRAAYDTALAQAEAADARMNLFRVGLARSVSDQILNKGETHDLTRQMLLPGARRILTDVLGDEQAAALFQQLRAEAAMQRTYQSQFGSQTTPLREAIDDLNFAPRFEAAWSNLGLGKVLQLASEYAARNMNNARNQQLMRLYTETDPVRQLDLLRQIQGVAAARSNARQWVGTPALGTSGATSDALMGLRGEPTLSPYDRPPRFTPVKP